MNENIRKLNRTIILFIAVFISFSGCTDLGMMSEEAETAFNEASVSDDSEKLTEASISFASGDIASSVTSDFTLSTSGDAGSTITWSSSNPAIITVNEDGSTTITRPTGSDAVVELTATITKGTATTTKIITVTVLAVEDIAVTFVSAVAADGTDGTTTTTMLTLTFSVDPTTLTADNITLTGATKSALSGTGTTRTLAISDITVGNGETVSVAISSPSGFTISGSPQTAVVYKDTTVPPTAVTFESAVQAGGTSGTTDSTGLTLTFSADPTTLAVGDITLTGATKSALSGTGTTRTLAISDITVGNGETVSVAISSPSGFTISGSPQTAVVYRAPTAVTFVSAVQTGGTSGTTDSTGLTLTFSVDPTTLTADNITLTGATKGALSGSGTTRTLAISDITVANGETVSVAITSPSGFTISDSPQTAVVYKLCLEITPDGNSSVSPDSNIEIVFPYSLDGSTKGTVSFDSPAVTFTDGDNAAITFSNTNTTDDTITINPNADLQSTNYTGISISGFKKSDSSDVTWSDSDYYFPVRGAMDLYFPFTNGSLEDASGRGVTLSPFGDPTLTAGHDDSADGAYSFDGAGDYMQVVGDLGISAGDDFTISSWIKLDVIGNFSAIVSNYHDEGLNALMFRVNSSWNGHTNALDLAEGYSNDNVLSAGTWLHVVGVYINASRQVQFYVDGVDAGTGTSNYTIEDQTTKFAIGGDYLNVSPRYFNGIIDEVRFYKYALTSTEVGNLYRNDDINDSTP